MFVPTYDLTRLASAAVVVATMFASSLSDAPILQYIRGRFNGK